VESKKMDGKVSKVEGPENNTYVENYAMIFLNL
jgi:hypothetical protein